MGGKKGLSRTVATTGDLVAAYRRAKGNGAAGGNGVGGGAVSGGINEDVAEVVRLFNRPGLPLTVPLPVIAAARVILVGKGYAAAAVDAVLGDLYGKPYVPRGGVAAVCPNACQSSRSCLLYGCRLALMDELVNAVVEQLAMRRQ